MRLVKVAVACVNQTPLAWDDNLAHLLAAIEQARAEGVTVLCLPELAITGYGCEDMFFSRGVELTAHNGAATVHTSNGAIRADNVRGYARRWDFALLKEIHALGIKGLNVMEAGRVYEW